MTNYTVALYTQRDQKAPTSQPRKTPVGWKWRATRSTAFMTRLNKAVKSGKNPKGDYFCFPQPNYDPFALQTPAPGLA